MPENDLALPENIYFPRALSNDSNAAKEPLPRSPEPSACVQSFCFLSDVLTCHPFWEGKKKPSILNDRSKKMTVLVQEHLLT